VVRSGVMGPVAWNLVALPTSGRCGRSGSYCRPREHAVAGALVPLRIYSKRRPPSASGAGKPCSTRWPRSSMRRPVSRTAVAYSSCTGSRQGDDRRGRCAADPGQRRAHVRTTAWRFSRIGPPGCPWMRRSDVALFRGLQRAGDGHRVPDRVRRPDPRVRHSLLPRHSRFTTLNVLERVFDSF
jgi:hypothetical protein